jgi:aspartyl-tRNA(Asn)/glutamyl-tRNA(Gln) amidotransferase subunit A
MNIASLTIAAARKALDAKEFSAVALTEAYIDAIRRADPDIHAYLEVWETTALSEAKEADARIARGDSMSLTGIPIAIKDNILIKDRVASSGSRILENYRAPYDAHVIEKLRSQGAIFLGRTNMDEFAMGSSTENSAYGVTKNPVDRLRVPGGSSGGSAAAVAGNMALASLGSDTGGSIRQPASLTGLVGLKPTYGSVSRYGLMAMGSSLDQIGPLTKSIGDCEILFAAIRGHDVRDSTSLPDVAMQSGKSRVLGVPRDFLKSGINPDVLAAFEKTLATLTARGYEIRDIALPHAPYGLAVYYIVMPAEASTNLARYDGIRYGHSVSAEDIRSVYEKTRASGFGKEVRRRILIGSFVLSSGYADAYYRRAQKVRALIRNEMTAVFHSGIDAIVMPTTPSPAFKLGEKNADPLSLYAEDIFTVPVNLAGVPALSQPMGTVKREGTELPIGFQTIAAHGREDILFSIGKDIEASL